MTMDVELIRQVVETELDVRSMRRYFRRIWDDLGTGSRLVAGWYLDAILDHVEAVGRFLLGKPGGIQRLAIAGPARSIKSTAPRPRLALWHRTTSQSHWAFTKLRRTA